MVYRPYQGEKTRFYANAALGLVLNPLRDDHIQEDLHLEGAAPMAFQAPWYITAGLQIQGIVGFNLTVPFTVPQFGGAEPPGDTGVSGLGDNKGAMNDVRIDGRMKLWSSNDRATLIGAHAGFTIATGTETGFGGDRGATALIALSAEHNFGPFYLTGHIGPHFRPDDNGIGDLDVENELRYAVGAFMPLRDNRVRVGVEVWGSAGIAPGTVDGRHTTVEWLAQGRFALSPQNRSYLNVGGGTRMSNGYGSADVRAMISYGRFWNFEDTPPESAPARVRLVDSADMHDTDTDGDGYPDDIDMCPDVKEDGKKPKPTDGCPAPKDSDGDGYPDSSDKCPNKAEDFDKIQDKDGCPEEDADKDTVKDEVDKCPLEPGPPNPNAEKNGCPTLTKVTADGTVALLKPIEFDRGKASIKPVSFPILKEVATLLNARANIKLSINGHTDNIGSHAYNSTLSGKRAASVLDYLVKQGIDSGRLSSEGFGPDKPIADNKTADGRARNRRVEFVIQEDASKDDSWE